MLSGVASDPSTCQCDIPFRSSQGPSAFFSEASLAGSISQKVLGTLTAIRQGDPTAAEDLLPLVYEELRRLAHDRLSQEKAGGTLQPTALVHEAYMRLVGDDGSDSHWENRAYFFAAAAKAMRRILVERARRRSRVKHGGGRQRIALDDTPARREADPAQILALDELLDRLDTFDKRKSEIVQLRYFAGMTVEETARAMDLSARTVEYEWRFARAWLHREMTRGDTKADLGGNS